MTDHRLPGMSISAEEWQALTESAQARGITRTEMIREAIVSMVATTDEPDLVRLQRQLSEAHRQLRVIRAALSGSDAMIAA